MRAKQAFKEYTHSFDLQFPCCATEQQNHVRLENAIPNYLTKLTLSVWVRSNITSSKMMCPLSYSLKSRKTELALFLLVPFGISLHLKGNIFLKGTNIYLLDGSWHHIVLMLSNAPSSEPYSVYIDGLRWIPTDANYGRFQHKGVSIGGSLVLGHLEMLEKGGFQAGSAFFGDISEVNLWDSALPAQYVKLLAVSKTRWKFPGNVVKWNAFADKVTGAVKKILPGEKDTGPFMWFGPLKVVDSFSYLCVNAKTFVVYLEEGLAACANNSFWALQHNDRVRNIMIPIICLVVGPDGSSVQADTDCAKSQKSSFRLLPDGRLQNVYTGLCLSQAQKDSQLFLLKCSKASLYFLLSEETYCPLIGSWQSTASTCVYIEPRSGLTWNASLQYCSRFRNTSLISIHNTETLVSNNGDIMCYGKSNMVVS
ncbi:uncharacterized protein LOC115472509 [Microcaecilia unicolor]|uniref:Uncharacterized protein LOC115472509 n=1 Tax=Microcaecilia unicolor TaxID=1415580 RepID=A0A6P7YIB7_9AMPH|nr:uncharacterized protein LOC115472509 [Microcaecilia unicolor]